ncbi:TCP-1/cpn60 chaperonin family protein [Haloferax volcanii]|uniref:Thermosome-like protein n=3 Tax=Halobacteriales TaxID=2235 RepID=D4GQY2_HALVD|nr:TCP-1/cpn60 chaperonin family protein [Haloferax volcanii]ADE02155.1 thermosome-like protein [Haloferax volcanii DS2]MBS8120761.1 TCP-1/cpn60 chaperonin family protein [Haloferax volcanii]MBS8125798.1 TCP-1/cpn60 chaperonin family protein [Haloferax volcanii]MBS8129582.1 TCP-1/cpn60 chaperonin family protein [Haloferax volcanii]MBS8133447.1 TCP-1/cpn60 chaperonin family protein [Haloferax volcanii]
MSNAAQEPAVPTDSDGAPLFPHANVVAVNAFADVLASALGPASRDKMIVNALRSRGPDENEVPHAANEMTADDITVTSDGASLLESLPTTHPIAPVVTRVIGPERPGETAVEGADIPDGVTATVVLMSELLDEAVELFDRGVHPYDLRAGYHRAMDAALAELDAATTPHDGRRATDLAIARTAMTGNDVGGVVGGLAEGVVDAVDAVGFPTEATLAVRCVSKGSMSDSRLVDGAVLGVNHRVSEEMPVRVEDATVLALGGFKRSLSDPELWTEGASLDLSSPDDAAAMEDVYTERRERVVDRIDDLGVDVVVTRLGINDEYQRLLADRGIVGIRRVNRLHLEQVARATGASVVTNPTDVSAGDLGHAGVVEEVMREPRRHRRKNRFMTVFEGCENPDSVTVLLRGVTDQIAAQATSEVRKAAAAVGAARGRGGNRGGVIPGGGAIELRMAAAVREAARAEPSRAQLAMTAFADALEAVVATLVRNAGEDHVELLADLKAAHAAGDDAAGFVLPDGEVGNAAECGVFDAAATKRRVVLRASEVANLVLRVDDAVDADFTEEPAGPGEAIYDEEAEKHADYLEHTDGTRWDI